MGHDNYSYGVYIYAFPIQQTIAQFWPEMSFVYYLCVTAVITIILAALSWHIIERPALKLKPRQRVNTNI